MIYSYSHDKDALDPYVDQFFTIESQADLTNEVDLIIPDCTPGILYIEKGEFMRKETNRSIRFIEGNIYLFGQKLKAVEYHYTTSNFKAFGVKLSPAAINVLFDFHAKNLCGKFVNITNCFDCKEKLINYVKRVSNVNPWNTERTIPIVLQSIINEINNNNGQVQIFQLAEKNGITYKNMQRMFNKHVGLSPKLYSRIIRFNHCVKLSSIKKLSLTELAYQGGFFDQNHFIKETKFFTGNIPSRIYKSNYQKLEKEQRKYLNLREY